MGLILVVVVATYALRRRRRSRDRLDDDFDVSKFGLVAEHHGVEDVEKSGALTAVERANSRGNGTGSGSSGGILEGGGSGSTVSFGSLSREPVMPQASTWMQTGGSAPQPQREMYDRTGYPALPVFVPQAPAKPTSYGTRTQRASVLLPDLPYLPSPYETAPAPPQNAAYAQGGAPPRHGTPRKKPPTLSPINVSAPPIEASPELGPMTEISLADAPVQPANQNQTANQPPRRRSLLPSVPPTPQAATSNAMVLPPGLETSHARVLDPYLKKPLSPAPAYSEDYIVPFPPEDESPTRRLVVSGRRC